KNLNETIASRYRNKFLGFVFQSFNLINYKSALDNVALPLYYQGIGRKERMELSMHYLEKVGLANWAKHLPNELSGGQKQRVAIARALASNPKVLLADEPTGALDTKTSYEVMDLLQQINDEGKTVLVVTHEQDIAEMTKRIVILKDGQMDEEQLTMFSMERWQEIFESLYKNKLRTVLTGVSVASGIFILVVLLGAGNGIQNGIEKQFQRDAVNRLSVWPGTTQIEYQGLGVGRNIQLKNSDFETAVELLKDFIEYKSAIYSVWSGAIVYKEETGTYSVDGVHPDYQFIENADVIKGRFLNHNDIIN